VIGGFFKPLLEGALGRRWFDFHDHSLDEPAKLFRSSSRRLRKIPKKTQKLLIEGQRLRRIIGILPAQL